MEEKRKEVRDYL